MSSRSLQLSKKERPHLLYLTYFLQPGRLNLTLLPAIPLSSKHSNLTIHKHNIQHQPCPHHPPHNLTSPTNVPPIASPPIPPPPPPPGATNTGGAPSKNPWTCASPRRCATARQGISDPSSHSLGLFTNLMPPGPRQGSVPARVRGRVLQFRRRQQLARPPNRRRRCEECWSIEVCIRILPSFFLFWKCPPPTANTVMQTATKRALPKDGTPRLGRGGPRQPGAAADVRPEQR